MSLRMVVAVGAALLIGLTCPSVEAQDAKPAAATAKGVSTRGLVTSLGGFSATVNAPLFVTGATVTLEPGGQTGRQQFRVPTFIYILEGVLTTEYEDGPVGIMGAQYHAAGQTFMDNGGWWHNHANRSMQPVRYLILHIGYPGRPDPIQKPAAE